MDGFSSSPRSAQRMLSRRLAAVISLACLALAFAPGSAMAQASSPRLNLTGAWEQGILGGTTFQLAQDGDRLNGTFASGNGTGFARGSWKSGSLILILTPMDAQPGGSCDARKLIVVAAKGASVTHIEPYVLDLGNGTVMNAPLVRTSPNPGTVAAYPYEAELKNCGQLVTYELAFETNSDKLVGSDWPILQTLADVMKKDSALKVQIAGHTDSTGSAATNQKLSENRAKFVVRTLTERYHVDASRLSAKGYGPDQPLADNDTEQGRAINRGVELVKQ